MSASRIRVGAHRAVFEVPAGLSTSGYGPGSPLGRYGGHPMCVRAIAVRDDAGGAVVLVVADIHAGTGLLHAKAAAALADLGLGPGQIVLAGTHTHTGPARIYGNLLYDNIAGNWLAGTDDPRAWRPVLDAIERAVREAWAASGLEAARATVAYLDGHLAGIACNRSAGAFPYTEDQWSQPQWPGHGAVGKREERLVDARLRGWVFHRATDGGILAVHALVACHNTALGKENAWDPDFVGRAMGAAEDLIGNVATRPVVSLALGAAGDQSPLPWQMIQEPKNAKKAQGEAHASKRAATLTEQLLVALDATPPGSGDAGVETRFEHWEPARGDLPASKQKEDLRLAPWRIGAAMLGGAEDGRSPIWFLAREGKPRKNLPPDATLDDVLQHPKKRALGIVQKLLVAFEAYAPAPRHPLHHVRIGDRTLVTVPGEPTVSLGFRIEVALVADRRETTLVQGYTGDYVGYWTTREEYDQQHYEGASTLYGRNAGAHLKRRLAALAKTEPNRASALIAEAPAPAGGPLPVLAPDKADAFTVDADVVAIGASPPTRAAPAASHGGLPPDDTEHLDSPLGPLWVSVWHGAAASVRSVQRSRGPAPTVVVGTRAIPIVDLDET